MCFERTRKKVEPFHAGYKLVEKSDGKYFPLYSRGVMQGDFRGTFEPLPNNEWLDEMAWRDESLLLVAKPIASVGWHVFSNRSGVDLFYEEYSLCWRIGHFFVVRVECYGLAKPYGLGLAYGKPAGRFQFMKILEEVE